MALVRLAKLSILCMAAAVLLSGEARAEPVAELKDASILGFRLGMSRQQVLDWFSNHKAEYPQIQSNTAKVSMPGVPPFDGALLVSTQNAKVQEAFLFQFSPPSDGDALVGIGREVNYGLDPNGPNARSLYKALYERYGMYPSSTFIGTNLFWAKSSNLPEEAELRQCTYTNNLSVQKLLPATEGCGTTLDVEIVNNSSHPGTVFIYRSFLWDQDRIVGVEKKVRAEAEAAKARNAAQQPASPSPRL